MLSGHLTPIIIMTIVFPMPHVEEVNKIIVIALMVFRPCNSQYKHKHEKLCNIDGNYASSL